MNQKGLISKVFQLFAFTAVSALFLTACTTKKQLRYFQDLPDQEIVDLPPSPREERTIDYGDQLDIVFSFTDLTAGTPPPNFFNRNGVISSAPTLSPDAGYIVNPLGEIDFVRLGKWKVLGMTARQLKEKLTDSVKKYMNQPVVDVKFVNFRISVLGAVGAPGTYTLNAQRTTLLDALAAAGDLPNNANRRDIQLYRDFNGKRSITKVDLTKQAVLTNPDVFQLRHNDVLIVQPRGSSLITENTTVFTSIVGILLSVISLALIIRNN